MSVIKEARRMTEALSTCLSGATTEEGVLNCPTPNLLTIRDLGDD